MAYVIGHTSVYGLTERGLLLLESEHVLFKTKDTAYTRNNAEQL